MATTMTTTRAMTTIPTWPTTIDNRRAHDHDSHVGHDHDDPGPIGPWRGLSMHSHDHDGTALTPPATKDMTHDSHDTTMATTMTHQGTPRRPRPTISGQVAAISYCAILISTYYGRGVIGGVVSGSLASHCADCVAHAHRWPRHRDGTVRDVDRRSGGNHERTYGYVPLRRYLAAFMNAFGVWLIVRRGFSGKRFTASGLRAHHVHGWPGSDRWHRRDY